MMTHHSRLSGDEVLHRRLPVAQRRLQPPLHEEVRQPLGDRVHQLPFLLEERALVGGGHLRV